MNQATKKYKNEIPAYWMIRLLSIVFLLNMVQCKCDRGVKDPALSRQADKNNLKTAKATLEGLADFSGAAEAKFKVKNDGTIAWNTDDIEIKITSSTAATFTVGSLTTAVGSRKIGTEAKGSLTEALGGRADVVINAGDSSSELSLRLDKANGKKSAKITIRLSRKGEGKAIATKTAQWTKGSTAEIEGLADFSGTAKAKFKVKNNEKIAWNTDEVGIEIKSSNKATFQVRSLTTAAEGSGTKIQGSLTDALGGIKKDIQAEDLSDELSLKLDKANGEKDAKITIRLLKKSDSTELASETIQWIDGCSAAIVDLAADFVGAAEAKFKVKNDGTIAWNTDDIEIKITSSNKATFQVGSLTTTAVGRKRGTGVIGSLTAALLGTRADIQVGGLSDELSLKLDKANKNKGTKITIRLLKKSDSTELASETIQWIDGCSAAIVDLAADFVGAAEAKFKVKNDGTIAWNTDDIEIKIESSNKATFQVGSLTTTAVGRKRGTGVIGSLTDALGTRADIQAGDLSDELSLRLDEANGKKDAKITIRLLKKKDGRELAKGIADWRMS